MRVILVLVLVLVTGGKQSQLLVLSLSLKFDKNVVYYLSNLGVPRTEVENIARWLICQDIPGWQDKYQDKEHNLHSL